MPNERQLQPGDKIVWTIAGNAPHFSPNKVYTVKFATRNGFTVVSCDQGSSCLCTQSTAEGYWVPRYAQLVEEPKLTDEEISRAVSFPSTDALKEYLDL